MKLRLVAVGNRPPAWVSAGFEAYVRRLPREMPLELVEVSPATRGNLPPARVREAEAARLLAQTSPRDWVIVLDERGRTRTTAQLAERLDDWRMQGRDVAFLIGGADGLDDACLDRADETLSLSPMTLPHALVRVFLAEQVYRAWTVLAGHPYHTGH